MALRVLLFSNLYPSSREPTRGMFNYHTFRALSKYCETRVISPLPWWTRLKHPGDLFTTPIETTTGIEARYPAFWTVPRLSPKMNGRAMYASVRGEALRMRKDFPFDAILACWVYPDAVAAAWLAKAWGCPLVTQVLGSDINALAQNPALREQIAWALGRSSRVVAVSGALRDRVVELGIPRERVIVQHNGVDGEIFRPRDRATVRVGLGLPVGRRLIGYVGNLKPEKGVDILVEAMGVLRDVPEVKDADLVLVGGGELEGPLKARVRALKLEDRVRFAGRRLHTEIPDWISAFDLFCLPSRREGCPNVVLESLASGRPVVAAAVGGVPELLNDDNGLLVWPDDHQALACAIHQALDRTWDSERLRASVSHLSWDAVGCTLRNVLAAAEPEPAGDPTPRPPSLSRV